MTSDVRLVHAELEQRGFVLKRRHVSDPMLSGLLAACMPGGAGASVHHRSGAVYGVRGLLWSSSFLRAELRAAPLSELAREALGGPAFPIDARFFDKHAQANWSVPGHQDRLMPVADGCTVKTTRNGIGYAEPTVETLEKLVALRVHFDDVDAEGGALGVVAGSHRRGVLRVAAIRDIPLSEYRPCIAERGDVLVMRPLILHRSGRHLGDAHRRVLHVVYATEQPPEPLRWREFG